MDTVCASLFLFVSKEYGYVMGLARVWGRSKLYFMKHHGGGLGILYWNSLTRSWQGYLRAMANTNGKHITISFLAIFLQQYNSVHHELLLPESNNILSFSSIREPLAKLLLAVLSGCVLSQLRDVLVHLAQNVSAVLWNRRASRTVWQESGDWIELWS